LAGKWVKREFRLTRSRDIKRVRETGKTVHHPLVVLVYSTSDEPKIRTAVVASKAIGNAVTRNLVKRRLKSCLALHIAAIKGNTDLVIYARKGIVQANFEEICLAITDLLTRADLLEN